MDPHFYNEITYLPRNPDDDLGYRPVLFRLNAIEVIPAYIRDLRLLAPEPSSELSRQISQRNIALVQRRIEAVGDLDPNRILKCYGYRFGDKPFMIVARGDEQALSRLVEKGDLNPLERLKLLYETGKAIQYLHSRRPPAVHGALHPRHILIAKPNSAMLSDFGLANVWRLLELDPIVRGYANWENYDIGLAPGATLGYTAPEYILDDQGEMLPPADIYAFASVILAVLSSRHPFIGVGVSSAKGIAAITQGVAPDPEDHPKLSENDSLWPLLRRMWSRDPAERPAIDEVMKQLEQELKIRSGEVASEIIAHEDVGGHPTCDPRKAESSPQLGTPQNV